MSALNPESEQDERPWQQRGAVRRDCTPHRGQLLVALGVGALVLSLLGLCLGVPVLVSIPLGGAVEWMARRDQRLMDVGEMDPAGRALARQAILWGQGGVLCGVLALIFCCPFQTELWVAAFR